MYLEYYQMELNSLLFHDGLRKLFSKAKKKSTVIQDIFCINLIFLLKAIETQNMPIPKLCTLYVKNGWIMENHDTKKSSTIILCVVYRVNKCVCQNKTKCTFSMIDRIFRVA